MPLLSKRIFSPAKGLKNIQANETINTIPHTKEQFRSKDDYDKRMHLYKKRIWTCQSTGHVNLTHEEAWNSERTVLKTLKEQFSPCYDKPVLELVHHSTKSLDCLVDQAWLMLQQTLVIGERVILKVKSGGKSMKAIIMKVDNAGVQANPTSNCNSPSSDKENEKEENAPSPKKWVPPKLLPYKYSIRFENDDSVIHSVPAADLGRGDKPPAKELMRLFIRTYAVRAGQTGTSPWIVDDSQVMKLDLQTKFASFLLSPVKWRQDEIAKKMDNELVKSSGNKSPRIKTKLDKKEANRKEKVKKKIAKIEQKTEKVIKLKEKSEKKSEVIEIDTSSSSDNESDIDDDNDTNNDKPLIKYQLTPKKKFSKEKSDSQTPSSQTPSSKDDKSSTEKKKYPLSLADLKKKMEMKKRKAEMKATVKGEGKKRKKKGQDPKQLTLFDLSKKKDHKSPLKRLKTPEKHGKSPLKEQRTPDKKKMSSLLSPSKTPIVIQKLQKALKNNDKSLVGTYSFQAAKILNSGQRARLPSVVKEMVEKKYNVLQERQKLSRMSESEKKVYLEKQAMERKKKTKMHMKQRAQALRKRFEDTALELKPLPQPKLVSTPDGMPNEAFGDVAMVTEFIANYAGLLMPDDQYPIYTDALMKALVSGKDGFTYLSRVLVVLLQTLLQDQIAEDYQELKVPLRDVPINAYTASELVRLSLRSRDTSDDKSDNSDISDNVENEVPEELVQLLETQELYNLEPEQKLQILKGLCLRMMGTYSVQDFMEQRQQELSRLWKEKLSHLKENKDKRRAEEKANKEAASKEGDVNDVNGDEGKPDSKEKKEEKASSMLLTHFYGKKTGAEDGQSSGNNSEAPMEGADGDVTSVIRRRRATAVERQQQAREEKIRKEKEHELQRQQRELENFEKEFMEGIYLAKVTQRQTPIGTDRNHSRYWVFSDVTPGLFVEKGWVDDEIDYTIRPVDAEDDIVSDMSDDDDEPEGTEAAPTAVTRKFRRICKCVDTTFPHVGQNLWFTFDSMKDVDDLIKALHPQGSRESQLKRELQKRYQDISTAVFKYKRSNKELRDCDGDKEMQDVFKKDVLETELRLRHGGLGGVDDFTGWGSRLETATDLEPMAECLLETQEMVLEKFREKIFAPNKKRSEVKEGDEDDEGAGMMVTGIIYWREAVRTSTTLTRLHVLLGILDSSIKWEKSSENAKCKICRKKGEEDKLLLCDDCNQAFHMYCLRPALLFVPLDEWHCPACAPQYRKRVRDVPGRYKEFSRHDGDNDDDDDSVEEVKVKVKEIKHDTQCVECGGDEELIECAECPSVYHLECHDPPLRHPPRGRWVCNDCKTGVKRRTRRGSQRAARKVNTGAAKRKRVASSSEEESSEDENSSSSYESDYEREVYKPPPKKAARQAKQQTTVKRVAKTAKKTTSPKTTGRPKPKKSSPEVENETRPKASRRAPSELSVIENIIDKMLMFKDSWPFQYLVKKHDVPDYYEIIKNPISFQRIKDRLNCLVYGGPQEVIDAVALLFRNAIQYNKVDSEIYDCVATSEKYFTDLLKRDLPFYGYSRMPKTNGFDSVSPTDGKRSRRSK